MALLHLLDWAVIALSFFNTVVLLWLGFTVLLNAERRSWGTWVAGGGLLLGGAFFVAHSAVVGRNILTFEGDMELWWRVGWLPFIGGPYLWYLVMSWYTGGLRGCAQRALLGVVSLLGLAALALLAFASPLPRFDAAIYERAPGGVFSLGGVPVAILIYPAYSVLCIALALSALRRPAASDRFMGDIARGRARPWLTAASLALLAISLCVGAAAAWFLVQVQAGALPGLSIEALALLIGFDLLISGMIAVAAILIGEAVVAYEVFTGKALPRRGLRRYWRRSLILAAGFGAVVGGSLALPAPIHPIWHLLIATALMTLFFALVSWRSYADQERSMARLRPFVASQRLYERVVAPAAAPEDLAAPLRALCDDVLGARQVAVVPLGPLAALAEVMRYPDDVWAKDDGRRPRANGGEEAVEAAGGARVDRSDSTDSSFSSAMLSSVVLRLSSESPPPLCLPVEPEAHGGAAWAVPLWSQRGPIGVLLVGPKRDGGLYTQEEFEIARAAGERLVDAAAGAEIARRLMLLQRQRLAESQVIDRRTRRVLHDEVLPKIHEAILLVGRLERGPGDRLDANPPATSSPLIANLTDIHRQIADLLRAMPTAGAPEVGRAGLVAALRHAVADDMAGAFDAIAWEVSEGAEQCAAALPPLIAEVGFYAAREAVRNAARHGRGARHDRPLHLAITVSTNPERITLVIQDDGVGIGGGAAPGGSGAGLALHTTLLAVVGGALTVESTAGRFTRVTLTLPTAPG